MKPIKIDKPNINKLSVLGISSPEKVYQFCYNLNTELKLEFQLIESHIVYTKNHKHEHLLYQNKKKPLEFPLYILQNQSEQFYVDKKLHLLNYFLIAKGDIEPTTWQNLIQSVKQVKGVQTTLEINLDTISNKHNFFVDEQVER